MGAVAIGEHPDQRVRVVQALPRSDDLRAVFLENRDLFFTKALAQVVDAACSVAGGLSGIHPNLEAARVRRDVTRHLSLITGYRDRAAHGIDLALSGDRRCAATSYLATLWRDGRAVVAK